ncbi:hypothetical protein PIB30_011338 [Stylosanthes scabra]|uniref:Uncharacterized protein n=1 Tax=Stylosanthes scabra TaxID=79078 RepID=A0ABU6W3V4_9FABA|nr:hypothetical protein [Stylosanthes scabra]
MKVVADTFSRRRVRLHVPAVADSYSAPNLQPLRPCSFLSCLQHPFADKRRNLNVSNGTQGSKVKFRVTRIKAAPAGIATPIAACNVVVATGEDATPATNVTDHPDPSSIAVGDSSQYEEDAKNPPWYNAMVLEALSALKDVNGSDLNVIVNFIEVRMNEIGKTRNAFNIVFPIVFVFGEGWGKVVE